MAALLEEEKHIKQENLRLQRKLQMETERREALCRHLSESESSLEMDDERYVTAVITVCVLLQLTSIILPFQPFTLLEWQCST